jgi:chemotaxis protein CheD
MKIIVGIGAMRVTRDSSDILITHALGACIGVALYDPAVKVGGLLRFILPQSPSNGENVPINPFIFADTGIPLLLQQAYQFGAEKSRLQVKVAGGAQFLDPPGFFNVGGKNHTAVRKILLDNDIRIQAEEIGGTGNRAIGLEIATGRVWVKTSGEGEKDI